jgi:hypothetical protein
MHPWTKNRPAVYVKPVHVVAVTRHVADEDFVLGLDHPSGHLPQGPERVPIAAEAADRASALQGVVVRAGAAVTLPANEAGDGPILTSMLQHSRSVRRKAVEWRIKGEDCIRRFKFMQGRTGSPAWMWPGLAWQNRYPRWLRCAGISPREGDSSRFELTWGSTSLCYSLPLEHSSVHSDRRQAIATSKHRGFLRIEPLKFSPDSDEYA